MAKICVFKEVSEEIVRLRLVEVEGEGGVVRLVSVDADGNIGKVILTIGEKGIIRHHNALTGGIACDDRGRVVLVGEGK